jgi:alkaline phosphatase D
MQRRLFLAASLITQIPGTTAAAAPPPAADRALTRIALGSCADQRDRQPIWDAIHGWRPDLMLMAGDNVYGDSFASDLLELREAYLAADRVPGFARMKRDLPVMAIWDDHDYGVNDAGAEFPWKQRSKDLFCSFWGVAADDPRRGREGLFHARIFGPPGRRVQVVLLDTRWFRSPLRRTDQRGAAGRERYLPDDDPEKTMLGEVQWRWLAEQLRQPAELRLIVSSIQVVVDGHGWERWGNLPRERARLYALIAETRASGVVFLSGDRHLGAFYRQAEDVPYPLHEMTSSGLTKSYRSREPGPNRLGEILGEVNFGTVAIDWRAGRVDLALRDVLGAPQRQLALDLGELRAR